MSDATTRIFELTRETCDRFNSYYLDFFESVAILGEERNKALAADDKEKVADVESRIDYMHGKIEELSDFMREITEKMPGFVEIIDAKQ